ncbi:MAG: hypothetical protein HOV87_11965 [Catenulispora sp.]|nr:hypothetical protein [Catenulispora sp.]NUT40034.1 hypothetical protein [Thermoactinospora sp.]
MSDLAVIQRRCEQLAASLGTPDPWSLDAFVEQIAALRQRPIHLYAQPLYGAVSSFWFADAAADHIVYTDQAPRLHRDHLVLHEIAHILMGHLGVPPAMLSDPAALRAVHGGQPEQEAELLAGAILAQARLGEQARDVPADVSRVLDTFDTAWKATPHVRDRLFHRLVSWLRSRRRRPDTQ